MTSHRYSSNTPLPQDLLETSDSLYNLQGSLAGLSAGRINEVYDGYQAGTGPIPEGNDKAFGIAGMLRKLSKDWETLTGNVAFSMESLSSDIERYFMRRVGKSTPVIRIKIPDLGRGVTTAEFVKALEEGSDLLTKVMKDVTKQYKSVQEELSDPMGALQADSLKDSAKALLRAQGPWESATKAFAEGLDDLAKALKVRTAMTNVKTGAVQVFREALQVRKVANRFAARKTKVIKKAPPTKPELVNISEREAQALSNLKQNIDQAGKELDREWQDIKTKIKDDAADGEDYVKKPEEYWELTYSVVDDILHPLESGIENVSDRLESGLEVTREEALFKAVESFSKALSKIYNANSKGVEGKDNKVFSQTRALLNKAHDQVPTQLNKPSEFTKLRNCFETIAEIVKALTGKTLSVPKIPNALDPEDPRQLGFGFKAARVASRYKCSAIGYSDEELAVLAFITSLKPAYRAKDIERAGLGEYTPNNPHIKSLIDKGLIKVNKGGAIAAVQPQVRKILKEEYAPEKYKRYLHNPSFTFKSREASCQCGGECSKSQRTEQSKRLSLKD